jgi:polygalacturonase
MRFAWITRSAVVGVLAAISTLAAQGQDTRTVVEPVFPPSCTTLQAQQAILNGEPASETIFDTTRLQAALNSCAVGQAIELQTSGTNNAFLIQPITIPTGVTLLVDGGVTVFASRNPADYQISGAETCGTVGTAGNGCNPLFNIAKNATSSGAGIMGYGVIDGRGEDKLLINGTPSANSWWDIANQADVNGGSQNNFVLLAASKASNFTLYKITLKNSAMFHVTWKGATGLTVWGTKIITPFSARNSDGIDPDGANITITNSSISDGDDNVAVSASSAASNITISNDNTYSGHGISVGSFTQGGLTNMLVTNINQAGTAADGNGIALRLKTALDRGGLLQNVTYQNICMQNHRTLILITPLYNTNAGTLIPQFKNITFRNIHGLTRGTMSIAGYDANHLTTLNLDNFVFDGGLTVSNLSPPFTFDTITLGPGPVSPAFLQTLTTSGVTYNGNVSAPATSPYPCSASTFTFLVGELFLSSSTSTNLSSVTVPGPGTVTLNAMLQPAMSQVTYMNSTGTAALTAPVQFFEGTNMVGTATLGGNGTIASLTLTGVAAGAHTYTAQYPGDSTYAAYSFGSVTVTVMPFLAPSTTTLAVVPSPVQAGSNTVLTATVAGTFSTAAPTGTVTFFDGTAMIGSASVGTATSGTTVSATLSTVLNGPGAHSLSAQYAGDSNNAGSTSPATIVTATAVPTATILSLASASVAVGVGDVLTAAVTSSAGVPNGTVTFFSGNTSLGTGTLNNGTAMLTTTSTTVGSETLTASYTPSGNFAGSTSAALMLSVTNPLILTPSPFAVSIAPGASGTVTITASPAIGFTGAVNFACASPVSYITCSLTPASQTIGGTTAVQSTLTLNVAASVTQLKPAARPGVAGTTVYALLLPFGAFALLGFARGRSLRKLSLLFALCLSIGFITSVMGCSGGSTPAPIPNKPTAPSGTQVVSVTAKSALATQTIQVTVNIGS